MPDACRVIAPTCEKSAPPSGPIEVIELKGRGVDQSGSMLGWAEHPATATDGV